jgi:hypothetical protein
MKIFITMILFYAGGICHANGLGWFGTFLILLGFIFNKTEFFQPTNEETTT